MLNSELAASKRIVLVSTAHSKCSIAVRGHLGARLPADVPRHRST